MKISNPHITIAGQTAPGDGICIRKYPLEIAADEVIIRYLKVRLGDESGKAADAISSRYTKNIILDHVSTSCSVDETLSGWRAFQRISFHYKSRGFYQIGRYSIFKLVTKFV